MSFFIRSVDILTDFREGAGEACKRRDGCGDGTGVAMYDIFTFLYKKLLLIILKKDLGIDPQCNLVCLCFHSFSIF